MIEVTEAYLTPNQYSRPQIKLRSVHGIVLHYVGNHGTSAWFNRNYFDKLKYQKKNGKFLVYASAHFIVDLSGEILVCVPPNEVAYHCGEDRKRGYLYTPLALDRFGHWPNATSIGIEMCHIDKAGTFTRKTLEATQHLCACLCEQFNLDPNTHLYRHFDITGKNCPKLFTDHPELFLEFKSIAHGKMLSNECHAGDNGD
jgi:N-acetylmuramoyl-L-alanine amidase